MTLNYWRDIWEPMTRQHYAQGGCYREVTYQRDERGNVAVVVGRVLSVDEAVQRRSGTVEIVYDVK
jgi:hypothetical protein